jgi:hypothetical protein
MSAIFGLQEARRFLNRTVFLRLHMFAQEGNGGSHQSHMELQKSVVRRKKIASGFWHAVAYALLLLAFLGAVFYVIAHFTSRFL